MRTDTDRGVTRGAVVVGVDGSPRDDQTVAWAVDQAARERRRLVVAHATGRGGGGASHREAETEAHGADPAYAAAAKSRRRHPELDVEVLVLPAAPGPGLRSLSDDAHLVVVGSRGHGLVRHLPTWQVGARVSRSAGCPVVVVPRHDPGIVRQGVLVGADLSEGSEPVLAFAYRQASLHDLPLTVAHVTRDRQQGRIDDERLLAESVSGLGEDYPDVHARLLVIPGSAAGALLRAADRMHLLVIGQHHAPGPYDTPVGHIRTSIVDRVTCPVAVVPTAAPRVAELTSG